MALPNNHVDRNWNPAQAVPANGANTLMATLPLAGAAATPHTQLFDGNLTSVELFDPNFDVIPAYNKLVGLWNALRQVPAAGVVTIWGIPIAFRRTCLDLLQAFIFTNINIAPAGPAGVGAAVAPWAAVPGGNLPDYPIFVKLNAGGGGGGAVINPVVVPMPGSTAGGTLSISDFGSALGYIFSLSVSTPVPAQRQSDNYALPIVVLFGVFLFRLNGLNGVQNEVVPAVVTAMWLRGAAVGTPARDVPLLIGASLCQGTTQILDPVNNTRLPPNIASGIRGKNIARVARQATLHALRPLPRIAPLKEANLLDFFKGVITQSSEVQGQGLPRAGGAGNPYVLTNAAGAATHVMALNLTAQAANAFQANFQTPRQRIRRGDFDTEILAFMRYSRRQHHPGPGGVLAPYAYPANQPGGAPLPYTGVAYNNAVDQFLATISVGRRPRIIDPPAGAPPPNTFSVPRNAGPNLWWTWENVPIAPLPAVDAAGNPVGERLLNVARWQNPDPVAEAANKSLGGSWVRSGCERVDSPGQTYGHCSETFPYLYFAQRIQELYPIPPGALNDANPPADRTLLEGISIDMKDLATYLRTNRAQKFDRQMIKGWRDAQFLRVLMAPCDNCKSLCRMHRHNLTHYATTLNTVHAIGRPGETMPYTAAWANNRPYW